MASHTEGNFTNAEGEGSHAEGISTTASGDYSHAEGSGTIASGMASHVQGKYNIEDNENKYAHIIGNGTSDSKRSNAFMVDWDGNGWFAGNLYLGEFKVLTDEDLNNLNIPTEGLKDIYERIEALESIDTEFEITIENLQELNTNREVEIDSIESDIDRIQEQIKSKADKNHNHNGDYDFLGSAANALATAMDHSAELVAGVTYSSIGAAPASHTHDYLPLSGGTLTGQVMFNASPVAEYNAFYNAKDSEGTVACLIGTGTKGVYLGSASFPTSQKAINVASGHVLKPVGKSTQELGDSEYRWSTIYSKNALNTSSDFNLKENIKEIPQKYIDMLDDIPPVIFKFKQGDRLHGGYISQWVEEAMTKHGITAEEFGGFCKDQKFDENQNPIEGEYQYSLRYIEFIPILHAKIKQLEKEIYELKNK